MSELITRQQMTMPVPYEPSQQGTWVDEYFDQKESDFNRYYQIVLKRKRLVLGVLLAAVAAASVWTYFTKPLYRSTVKIQIDSEQSVLPYKEIYEAATTDPRYLGTQAEVLKSDALSRRVVQRLNLESDPARIAGAVAWIKSMIQVTPVLGAQVLSVSVEADDPTFAANAINVLADEYVDYRIETKVQATTAARNFLEKELHVLGDKLEQSEEKLVNYSREHDIPDANNNVTVQKLGQLSTELTRVESQLLSSHYRAIQHSTPENFPEGQKTEAMKHLDARLLAIQQQLAGLTVQFGPKWPEVVALQEELAGVQRQRVTETQRAVSQAKLAYDFTLAHQGRVAAALAEQNRGIDRLAQASIQYNIIKREVESDRQLHDGLLQRLKETDVSAGLKAANIHVIDRGQVARKPFSPNVPLRLSLALLLGLVSGMVAAVFLDFRDRTIKTAEDVERKLHLPFLGSIPVFEKSWKEATGGLLVAPVLEPQSGQAASTALYVPAAAETCWESYRSIRTSLLFSSSEGRPKSILITSSQPGEGKSTTAINLAIVLAQTGARPVILEVDMRRPRLAERFRLPSGRGLSRYLSGHSVLNTEVCETDIPNLSVVPAGPVSPNPPELLGSARMDRAMKLLGRYFDFIVIDGPPLVVTDALVLSPQVSGVLFVVRANMTSQAAAERARHMLRSVDARILGVVVNGADGETSSGYSPVYHSGVEFPPAAKTALDVRRI